MTENNEQRSYTLGEFIEDALAGKKQYVVDLVKELAANNHTKNEIVSKVQDCLIESISSVFPEYASYLSTHGKLYFLEASFIENSMKNLLNEVLND